MSYQIDSAKLAQRMRNETAHKRGLELQRALMSAFFIPLVAILTTAFLIWMATLAYGGGTATVTWNQSQDCASIARWDLLSAAITSAQPNPTVAQSSIVGSITNAAPVVCGPSATSNIAISGVGNMRFWLRAVSTGSPATTSVSNSVDTNFPLAAPLGLGIAVP